MKVDFMLIGAPKCATTTLAVILAQHPQIEMSSVKEPNFFSEMHHGQKNMASYHQFFSKKNHVIYGEASTTYSFFPLKNPDTAKQIFNYNPNVKIMYVVRNPYDRIISQYVHWRERGFTEKSLEEALFTVPELIYPTRYFLQIEQYLNHFPKQQIMVFTFEEFTKNKTKCLSNVAQFLDIEGGLFDDFDDIFENKSMDGSKKHHSFDSTRQKMQWIKKILPKSLITKAWNLFTQNKQAQLKERPALSIEQKKLIYNVLKKDIHLMEKTFALDLSDWKISQFD